MDERKIGRRHILKALTAAPLLLGRAGWAEAPAETQVTPGLIEAAKKEGKVIWYTAVDLPVAEHIAKAFEEKYPGISVRVERSGGERIFQRISQEYASNIHAVDVVNSSDAAHFIVWKRDGILAPYVPEDVARHYPAEHKDPGGLFASWRVWLSVIGYNTKLVKAEEAPKSFADLLDPKWTGKIVKGHPGYSGTIMTATFQISRDLGWQYFEKLARQRVMQVQSSADPPKKLALGERAVMADGNEYNLIQLKEKGEPVEVVYPLEGSPLIIGPSGLLKDAPHPNAARLLQSFMFARETQQMMVDYGGLRSFHAQVKDKPGRKPLREIKLMKDDPAAVEKQADEIKARYTKIFKV
ncbi:MAG: ABC transporter substrate-binding protein [Deltaproteobacteria bacterium]